MRISFNQRLLLVIIKGRNEGREEGKEADRQRLSNMINVQ
jgi:hypothetical protein